MKKWLNLLPHWAIILILSLLVFFSISTSYFGFPLVSKIITLAIIPFLLMVYFSRQRVMSNKFLIIFILYFLGLLFDVMNHWGIALKLSELSYLIAYVLLISVMVPKLKYIKYEGVVSTYLTVILLVNTYLMYTVFNMVKGTFADNLILTLSVSKYIALLVMGFLAFAIYLSKESLQSIIFLIFVCCYVFSDALGFITSTYIYFWVFEGIQKILLGLGLFLYTIYVYNHHEKVKRTIEKAAQTIPSSEHIPV